MLKTKLQHAGAAFAILLTASAAFGADEPVSREAGVLPVTVKAGQPNLVGLPFTREPVASGSLTAVSGTTLTDSAASLTLSGGESIIITTGAARGTYAPITTSTATTVTVAAAITGAKTGDAYDIIPAWTLNSLLGSTPNPSGLVGASSPGSADTVLAFDAAGTQKTYYYNSLGNLWLQAGGGFTGVGDDPLLANSGIVIFRQSSAGDLTLYLQGVVRKGNQVVSVKPGTNLYFHTNPSAVTLGTSGLYTGSSATGVVGGTSPGSADTVRIFRPDGSSPTFYYNTLAGFWLSAGGGFTSQNGEPIPAGSSVLLIRQAGAGEAAIATVENVTP